MKLVIDVPEKEYDAIKRGCWEGNPLADYIENGTPLPDNATNRDVLKAVFPECSIDDTGSGTYLKFKDNMFSMMVENDWLSAPYKVGDTDDKDIK